MSLDEVFKLKNERHDIRKPILEELGFVFSDGLGIWDLKGVYSMYWETIVNQDDDEFKEQIIDIKEVIAKHKEKGG